MKNQPVTIVSFEQPDHASALQGELSGTEHPCRIVPCDQWLKSAAADPSAALILYFGRGMPAQPRIDEVRDKATGRQWRAVFEGERPTRLPRSFLLPPRYFLWPDDRDALVRWLDTVDDAPDRPRSAADLGLLGRSPPFRLALSMLDRFAPCAAPMLITGETGTGKETAARAAHRLSDRAAEPFIALHCGAVPDDAFDLTGAVDGPLARVRAGTLFLNNLEDLSQGAQIGLSAWLQSRDDLPDREGPRVMAATGADLAGGRRFRSDLFYRLSVLTLRLPPLRDRPGDAEILGAHFADRYARQTGRPARPLSDAFRKALRGFDWPGNVRELQNVMHRSVVLSTRPELCLSETGGPGETQSAALSADVRPYHEAREATLRAFEAAYLHKLMAASGGNVTRAARLAGTERRSLGRMLKRNDLSPAGGIAPAAD